MANDLYWQESLSQWDWSRLASFLADEIPEGQHLEYKEPSRKQNGKWDITHELVETIVAMANTDDGLLIVGVADAPGHRPGSVVGVDHPDPEGALRNFCAGAVEPIVPLEIRSIEIPVGELDAGKAVIVVRLRRGLNPPYLLRDRGVFIRHGDQDRQAVVRDLQALFDRRAQALVPPPSPWTEVLSRIFQYLPSLDAALPPVLAVGLTPTFPIPPIAFGPAADGAFEGILRESLGIQEAALLEPNGLSFTPDADSPPGDRAAAACAFADGSIGLRLSLDSKPSADGTCRELDVTMLWHDLRRLLLVAARWPHEVCGVTGPLHYQIGSGNLPDVVLVLAPDLRMKSNRSRSVFQPPARRNRMPTWVRAGEMDPSQPIDDLIERELSTLARQLQCRFYQPLQSQIRAWAST